MNSGGSRLPGLLLAAAALGALLLRWRMPGLAWQDRPAYAWAGLLLLAMLGLDLLRLALEALRRRLPWTRLLLPGVLLAEGLGLAVRPGPGGQRLRLATALVLELALLVLAARAWLRRPRGTGGLPEDALIPALGAFLPPGLARMAALELALVGGALGFLLGGWRRPDPAGFAYTRKAGLGMLLPALPLLLAGDVVLLEVLTRHAPLWLRVLLHAAGAYGFLWIVGLWASMRRRPHTVQDGVATFHRGILGSLAVPLERIEGVETMPVFQDDWARLAFLRGVMTFGTSGPPFLLLKLKAPIAPLGLLGPGKARDRVRVFVDDPEGLRKALGAGPTAAA